MKPITPNKGTVNDGFDKNFFSKTTVSNTDFETEATVVIFIRTSLLNLSFINEGNNVLEYSFNGNTLHGDLTPSTPSESLSFSGRNYSKIWFRAPSGASALRVEAWGE